MWWRWNRYINEFARMRAATSEIHEAKCILVVYSGVAERDWLIGESPRESFRRRVFASVFLDSYAAYPLPAVFSLSLSPTLRFFVFFVHRSPATVVVLRADYTFTHGRTCANGRLELCTANPTMLFVCARALENFTPFWKRRNYGEKFQARVQEKGRERERERGGNSTVVQGPFEFHICDVLIN